MLCVIRFDPFVLGSHGRIQLQVSLRATVVGAVVAIVAAMVLLNPLSLAAQNVRAGG